MKSKELGFTLIEVLVSVAIIGLLAAIAIPEFKSYKARAYESTAIADLKNATIAMEAHYIDNNDSYASCGNRTTCTSLLPGFTLSEHTGLLINVTDDDESQSYVAVTCTTRGFVNNRGLLNSFLIDEKGFFEKNSFKENRIRDPNLCKLRATN